MLENHLYNNKAVEILALVQDDSSLLDKILLSVDIDKKILEFKENLTNMLNFLISKKEHVKKRDVKIYDDMIARVSKFIEKLYFLHGEYGHIIKRGIIFTGKNGKSYSIEVRNTLLSSMYPNIWINCKKHKNKDDTIKTYHKLSRKLDGIKNFCANIGILQDMKNGHAKIKN